MALPRLQQTMRTETTWRLRRWVTLYTTHEHMAIVKELLHLLLLKMCGSGCQQPVGALIAWLLTGCK